MKKVMGQLADSKHDRDAAGRLFRPDGLGFRDGRGVGGAVWGLGG